MAKITFTSNIYREAFALIGRGLSMACKETGRVLNEAVHSQPYIFIAAEALIGRSGNGYIDTIKVEWEE